MSAESADIWCTPDAGAGAGVSVAPSTDFTVPDVFFPNDKLLSLLVRAASLPPEVEEAFHPGLLGPPGLLGALGLAPDWLPELRKRPLGKRGLLGNCFRL